MTYIEDNNYRKPFMWALMLHILLFIVLFAHFKFLPPPNPVVQNSTSVINAVAVNQSQLQGQMQNQLSHLQVVQQQQTAQAALQVEQQRLAQQQAAKIAAEKAVSQQAAEQKQAQAKAAQQQAALLAAQQAQEKLTEEKAKQQQLKDEQVKHAAALKVQQEKAKEEQKRLAQLAIQQALEQQEQQSDQAKQVQDKQKQMQAAKLAAQQLLQQQLAATDASQNSTQPPALSAAARGQIDKYSAMIISAIGQQWIIPDSSQKGLQGKMQVSIAPGGMVLNVTITQSSGDAAFDRSARAAVFKASPLPVPKDPTLLNQFRTLNLTFKPAGMSNS